jgi:large subunit ribosomal protein L37Ae
MTKKVKSAGRFGARYGRKVRWRVTNIEQLSRSKHICPRCLRVTLKRAITSIWVCKKCGLKIAGGAFEPTTDAQKVISLIQRGT